MATVTALMGLFVMTASAAAPIDQGGGGSPQQAIVVFHDNVDDPGQAAAQLTSAHGGQLGFVYQHALKGFSATLSARAMAAIERNPQVAYVELDQEVSIFEQTTPTGVQRIFADDNTKIGINGVDDSRVDVDVAVLDTGIDLDHPDLNVVASTDCSGGSPFKQSCGSGGDDDNGHGTHVAGTIAALDNDFGVVGVAPGARLWSVKVLRSDGSGYLSWIIAGIDYVTANKSSIEVANMSLGGAFNNDSFNTAISNSVAAGVAYAVAAGNSSADAINYSPASHPEVLTVSALADFNGEPGGLAAPTCREDEDDTFANFSNFGDDPTKAYNVGTSTARTVPLIAPGVCILSTVPGGGYDTFSGTSMASPHAAGALALLASGTNSPSDAASVYALYEDLILAGNDGWSDSDDPDGFKEPLLDVADSNLFAPAFVPGTSTGTGDSPLVSIVNPANGSEVSGSVTIQVDASDTEDDVGSLTVEVSIDGAAYEAAAYNSTSSYYELSWVTTSVADGPHTIDARATDSDSNATDAAQVTVTTENTDDSPSVSIVNPADGSEVSGPVTIQVDASDDLDDVGSLTVEVSIDGAAYEAAAYNLTSGFYEFSWDTSGLEEGSTHTIDARATDSAANTTDAAPVTVTVNNSVSYVVGLAGGSINNGSSWTAVVTITVTDLSGNPLGGIVVAGTWSNGASVSDNCTTGPDGTCLVEMSGILKRVSSVTFTVDTVGGITEFGGESSIIVSKP